MTRAVIDLNVIISALIVSRGAPFHVWSAWLANRFTLIISEGMIHELVGKLAEPRIALRYGIATQDVRHVRALLRGHGMLIEVPRDAVSVVTGDPEDDLVLATGWLGHAEYLVTRDQRLLDLGAHGACQVVTPHQFLQVLRP